VSGSDDEDEGVVADEGDEQEDEDSNQDSGLFKDKRNSWNENKRLKISKISKNLKWRKMHFFLYISNKQSSLTEKNGYERKEKYGWLDSKCWEPLCLKKLGTSVESPNRCKCRVVLTPVGATG